MADDLILYTNPMSRGRIARWMLEETGIPYTTEILDYATSMKAPEYLAINPLGKVPAIRHGDTIITECAAICSYLADAFPAAGLAPPPEDRGRYYRWLFFAAGPLEQAVTNKAMGFEVPEDKTAMAGYGTLDTMIAMLSEAVAEDGYIAGSEFSAADVYVGSHIGWGMQFGTLPENEAFKTYFARISDREAYRRANTLDDAAMPKQQG